MAGLHAHSHELLDLGLGPVVLTSRQTPLEVLQGLPGCLARSEAGGGPETLLGRLLEDDADISGAIISRPDALPDRFGQFPEQPP